MSDNNEDSSKLDSELNPSSPEVVDEKHESLVQLGTASPASPSSLCVLTNPNQDDDNNNNPICSNDLEAISTVLIGCSYCLMYMMIPKNDLKCPKCDNVVVLLDFLDDD